MPTYTWTLGELLSGGTIEADDEEEAIEIARLIMAEEARDAEITVTCDD